MRRQATTRDDHISLSRHECPCCGAADQTANNSSSSSSTTTTTKMASDDDLNFENNESIGGGSSVAFRSSQSSTTSSLLSNKYRTKSKRRRMRLSEQSDQEEKTVRFSLSVGRDSLDSALSSSTTSRRRRYRKKTYSNGDDQRSLDSSSLGSPSSSKTFSQSPQRYSQDSPQGLSHDSSPSRRSLLRSSQDSLQSSRVSSQQYFESPTEEMDVRGAGTNVHAVQDAGSYRMLFDDASYLCSTICGGSPASALDAACDLALLLSDRKKRSILLSVEEGGAALISILETLSALTEPKRIGLDGILGVEQEQGGDYDVYCGRALRSPDGKMIPNVNMNKSQTKTARKRALEKQQTNGVVNFERPRNHLLHEALAAAIHFLSWDCTTREYSSSSNASRARQVRSAILEHPTALRSACYLALMDPVVEDMLSKVTDEEGTVNGMPKGSNKSESSVSSRMDSEFSQADNDGASRASSVDTHDSLSSLRSDLATAGRKKRRKKRRIQIGQKKTNLDAIAEDQEFHFPHSPMKPPAQVSMVHMSYTSDDESISSQKQRGDDASVSSAALVQNSEKLAQVRAAIVQLEVDDHGDCKAKVAQHTCELATNGVGQSRETSLLKRGDFVLKSICRIVDGKEGEEDSCIDNETEVKRSSEDLPNEQEDNEEEQFRKNPLLITNTLLRKGGTLPLLARAMAETLSAVIVSLSTHGISCTECLLYLKQRVSVLAALIDGACCLTPENRQELCSDGSQLIASILLLLKTFSDTLCCSSSEESLLDEIALLTLRTLTSLTHDNVTARGLLMMSYKVNMVTPSVLLPGVLILADLLWKSVTNSKPSQHHSAFDMVILCLNTLTNAVEAKNLRRILVDYKVPVKVNSNGTSAASAKEEIFLCWLSRWLFLETTNFRDAVMRGTFGQKEKQGSAHEMRNLEKDDEEHLITAGNGFIFMACLMRKSKILFDEDGQLFATIREVILKELEVDDKGNGLLLIKNTLKAFCNFYHYSLGDLSVAIVAPVSQLIVELDRMEALQANKK